MAAADYDNLILNTTWPPGRTDYPAIISSFIDLNGEIATEVEEAIGAAISSTNLTQLVDSLEIKYIKYSLKNNIYGSNLYYIHNPTNETFNSLNDSDYVTKGQVDSQLLLRPIDYIPSPVAPPYFNDIYTIPHSELLVDTSSNTNNKYKQFIVIPQDAHSVTTDQKYKMYTNNNIWRIPSYNCTYLFDGDNSGGMNRIELNAPKSDPVNGDRLKFIFQNTNNIYITQTFNSQLKNWLDTIETNLYLGTYNIVTLELLCSDDTWYITNVGTYT